MTYYHLSWHLPVSHTNLHEFLKKKTMPNTVCWRKQVWSKGENPEIFEMCRKSVHTFRLKPNNFQMNYRFETHCKKKPVIRFDILTQKTTKNSINSYDVSRCKQNAPWNKPLADQICYFCFCTFRICKTISLIWGL